MSTTGNVQLTDIEADRLPRHIAVIMDGNGRWAQRQQLPRIEGHRMGVASVRRTVEAVSYTHLTLPTICSV